MYRSAFENGAGDQWSKKLVRKSPSGKHTFLGPFSYESTMLSLDNLPEHARVRLSFDLMIILTWDGDANLDHPDPTAPDLFDVTVDRGPRLVHASFVARPSSETTTQSFPGRFPYDHMPPGTAAVESRSLGYFWPGGIGRGPDDYVYHIERSFAHGGKSLKVAFSGINLEGVDNECWGLENVRVEVLPAEKKAGTLDEAAFGKLWKNLASADPKMFVPAIDALIDLGEPGVAAIHRRLVPPAVGPAQDRRIGTLIAQLDSDAYLEREQAMEALRELGAAAESALCVARRTTTSLEARVRIDKLLRGLKRDEAENDGEQRLRRVAEVLELVGGEQARGAAGHCGAHGNIRGMGSERGATTMDGKTEIPTKLDLPPGLPTGTPAATR